MRKCANELVNGSTKRGAVPLSKSGTTALERGTVDNSFHLRFRREHPDINYDNPKVFDDKRQQWSTFGVCKAHGRRVKAFLKNHGMLRRNGKPKPEMLNQIFNLAAAAAARSQGSPGPSAVRTLPSTRCCRGMITLALLLHRSSFPRRRRLSAKVPVLVKPHPLTSTGEKPSGLLLHTAASTTQGRVSRTGARSSISLKQSSDHSTPME